MRDFRGKVAVVTGAAGGLGKSLAETFAREGMKVVLADIEEETLDATAKELTGRGCEVLAVQTDVTKLQSMEELARRVVDAYGGVHILCNNAGVTADRDWSGLHPEGRAERVWELDMKDWQWVFDVNVWGVIHGLKAFMPVMLAQGTEGHIVNTASPMGFGASELLVIYATSKTCVNTISESLYLQLARMGAPIGVTIVLAAPISTRLYDAYRNRPRELAHESDLNESVEQRHQRIAQVRQIFAGGHPPQEVAEMVLQGIRDNRFYLFTRPEELENPSGLRRRFENILTQRNP